MTATARAGGARRGLRKAAAELHYRLRTEGDTPARQACAVGLGTFIGCLPLYGLHLTLCFGVARLLRLNRLTTYLAAHVNNPFTAPWLLYASFALGHRVLRGAWPALASTDIGQLSLAGLGGELAFGSLLLAVACGVLLGSLTAALRQGRAEPDAWALLAEEVAGQYFEAGVLHWEFARGKLRHDPVYRELARRARQGPHGGWLDLGCGRGLGLAVVSACAPPSEPASPAEEGSKLQGVDLRPSLVAVASRVLGPRARVTVADLRHWSPSGTTDNVLLFDVLHYLDAATQEAVLVQAIGNLAQGGRILLREADGGAGLSFLVTRCGERVCALARGALRQRFHYRSAAQWRRLLEGAGLVVEVLPMSEGTPFANVLLEGRLGSAG